jgi:hypothetical protein
MRRWDVMRLIPLIALGAALGCAATPGNVISPACSEPPHSRFHPAPTRPVFENDGAGTVFLEMPPVPIHEPLEPELPTPPSFESEPHRLPEFSAKPIHYERPSSRRMR